MWIKTIVLVGCVLATLSAEERASKAKKEDPRGKRNLQYSIAHHYNGPHSYRLERRISAGPQIPLYQSQFFPGPRSHSPYHKDGQDDLLTDNNHLSENVYGPQPQKHVIERPVYIKEPEPIIEIIIKESNVTLPPPPAPPTPPPKKKEQVQVFYVKYKKNPGGHGKDAIIYDKPVPAISPPVQDEVEEPPPEHHYHQEVVTSPPPPSTTLRTIIRPDSETYHSPSGVKVTFGKEGFDYDKRSSKPEDLRAASGDNRSVQFPQGRQLSSFPPSTNSRRPPNYSFNQPPPSNHRQPQPYQPFGLFRQQSPANFPPRPQQYSTLPKFPQFQQPTKNNQHLPPPRPVPPQFQQRQPVPYQPFESLRSQPPVFRHQTHFPITQAPPVSDKPVVFNQFGQSRPQFNEPRPKPVPKPQFPQKPPAPQFQQSQPQFPVRPQFHQPQTEPQFTQELPHRQQTTQFQQRPSQFQQRPPQHQQLPSPQFQQQDFQRQQPIDPQFQHQQPQQPPVNTQFQQPQPDFSQFNHQLRIIPPGGELIHSLPKFEQHISVSEPANSHSTQFQQPQPQIQQSSIRLDNIKPQSQIQQSAPFSPSHQQTQVQIQQSSTPNVDDKIQQQLREANALQESIRQSSPQFYNFQQQNYYHTTSKPTSYFTTPRSTTTTSTTTTTETSKPSTTTKDPKVLEAQLPDEVPDDLRQQLLSSGILQNAQISILDYDKVGDIPLSALPPDQLANFYNAGGAQQIQSGSEPVPSIAEKDIDSAGSEIHEVKVRPEVQMKVVRYDPESDRGQQVQDAYVKDDATQVNPVVLNDEKYNRYLPLKVNGAQFPIPDVPELKGKKISSVVVLAPVQYDFSSSRPTRETKEEKVELVEGQLLKELLGNPTKENFEKFLENENKTRSDKQSVILLVTGCSDDTKDKEIFMYDIATQTVSKLNGELSTAFVEAAEANSFGDTKTSASEMVETRVPYKVPIIDPSGDLETEASEHLESFVDVSGIPVDDDLAVSETHWENKISNFGISKTGRLS